MPSDLMERHVLDSRTDKPKDILNELVERSRVGEQREDPLSLLDFVPQRLIKPKETHRPALTSIGRDLEEQFDKQHKPTDAERKEFHDNLEQFLKNSLSYGEKAATLKGLKELLNSRSSIFSDEERARLAQQALKQAARPDCVSQGDNRTCSVTSLENVLYRTKPSAVIDLLVQVSKSGKFNTADKTVVEADKNSLKADEEALKNPTPDGERSFASQVFQVLAVNAYWARQDKGPDGTAVARGKIQYRHNYSDGKDVLDECLLDTSKSPPVVLKNSEGKDCRSPKLGVDQLPDVYKQITGLTPSVLCVRYGPVSSTEKGIRTVASPAELEAFLQTHKNQPLIVKVDSSLLTEEPVDPRTSPTTGHDVVIVGYDATKRRVKVDNSWSNGSDHLDSTGHGTSLPVKQMFKSMNPPWGFKKE